MDLYFIVKKTVGSRFQACAGWIARIVIGDGEQAGPPDRPRPVYAAGSEKRSMMMAASILTMLKAVPWNEVLSAAPSVVGGARKLWDSVGSKPAAESVAPASEETMAGDRFAALSARLDRSEQDVAALKSQMREASALIASLADQNSQLIVTMEQTRRRNFQLAAAVAVLACACVVLAVFVVGLVR